MCVELANREEAAGGVWRNVRGARRTSRKRLPGHLVADHVVPHSSALTRSGLSVRCQLSRPTVTDPGAGPLSFARRRVSDGDRLSSARAAPGWPNRQPPGNARGGPRRGTARCRRPATRRRAEGAARQPSRPVGRLGVAERGSLHGEDGRVRRAAQRGVKERRHGAAPIVPHGEHGRRRAPGGISHRGSPAEPHAGSSVRRKTSDGTAPNPYL
jgi:hypothetical protein